MTLCLPSRLSRVRVPSPAPSSEPSLYWLTTGRFVASKRCESQQAGGFMMRKKVCSDILPHFGVTSCLARRDILPWRGRNILPSQLRDILPRPLSPPACLLARQKPQRRHNAMFSKDPRGQKNAHNAQGTPPQSASTPTKRRATTGSRKVTEARANAQRTKLDAQADARR